MDIFTARAHAWGVMDASPQKVPAIPLDPESLRRRAPMPSLTLVALFARRRDTSPLECGRSIVFPGRPITEDVTG